MSALDRFVTWLQDYVYIDRHNKLPTGLRLQYHSRSDEHSKMLGQFIVDDLLATCPVVRDQAASGEIAYGINHVFVWPNGKAKTLDLAIGIPAVRRGPPEEALIHRLAPQTLRRKTPNESLSRLLVSCEEKAVMTEHGKSQPRLYSELNDSHVIVHGGSKDTIATGIAMVNIASTFVSPLRQRPNQEVIVTAHNQPAVAENMVSHLRKLPLRDSVDTVGLDAFCTFVIDADNQGHVALHTVFPAPQPGDPDHYETFLARICRFYVERFSDIQALPPSDALTVEASLKGIVREHPGLLYQVGDLAVESALAGATELQAIFRAIEDSEGHVDDPSRVEL